jgi:N-methylhydantoinase A
MGGDQPTVTDANVVLGYINPDYFLGGRREINPAASARAVDKAVAKPLGLTTEQAADGIFQIVNTNMVDAIRVVSVEKGIDPRGYSLVVGGGAGAIHAGALGQELGMKQAIIPRYSGVFCSFGMIASDVRHDLIRAFATNTSDFDLGRVNEILADLEAKAIAELKAQGFARSRIKISRFADAKYSNQIHELTIPIPSRGKIKKSNITTIAEEFHGLHERMFSYCVRESAVDLFHWRVTAVGMLPEREAAIQKRTRKSVTQAEKGTRMVYFRSYGKYRKTKLYDGDKIQHGMIVTGPAIVEQANSTIVVPPKQTLKVNRFGDFVLEIN